MGCVGNGFKLSSHTKRMMSINTTGINHLDTLQIIVTQWSRRFRPHKVYIFLISITTPRKKRTKKIKNIFHEMQTIRSPFLVLTFGTFVHENRTVLVQFLPTNNLVPNCEKCSQISNAVHEKAAIDALKSIEMSINQFNDYNTLCIKRNS